MHNVVQALLKVPRINLNEKCELGNTAMHQAFLNRDKSIIEMLIKRGATADLINMENKTPYQVVDKQYLKEIGFDVIKLNFK